MSHWAGTIDSVEIPRVSWGLKESRAKNFWNLPIFYCSFCSEDGSILPSFFPVFNAIKVVTEYCICSSYSYQTAIGFILELKIIMGVGRTSEIYCHFSGLDQNEGREKKGGCNVIATILSFLVSWSTFWIIRLLLKKLTTRQAFFLSHTSQCSMSRNLLDMRLAIIS